MFFKNEIPGTNNIHMIKNDNICACTLFINLLYTR